MADLPEAPGIEPYYSEAEVAKMLDPSGKRIKARSIRSERENKRLVGTRVAGKWMYRKSDVQHFLEDARCPEPIPARDSSFVGDQERNRFSASNGPKGGAASDTEPAFLPPSLTRRRSISGSGCEGAPKRKGPGQVVPIRSE
jgi:hypothetical protein